jgi:transcription termination factor Rho
MSILDRAALQASPLADLHAMASELSIDGYRRLRRAELIDAILRRQDATEAPKPDRDDGAEPVAAEEQEANEAGAQQGEAQQAETEEAEAGVGAGAEELIDAEELAEAVADELSAREGEPGGRRRRRGRRGGRGRGGRDEEHGEGREREARTEAGEPSRAAAAVEAGEPSAAAEAGEPSAAAEAGEPSAAAEDAEPSAAAEAGEPSAAAEDAEPSAAAEAEERPAAAEEEIVDGVVELVANGSGFVRAYPPEPSDDDVYISAAQVKRCELLSGDRITGPRRPPRRSERFASMIRIDTINGVAASEVADSARFDELPATFAHERLQLGSDDPTITAIEGLTPIGKGSRVAIAGAARAGKSETLRRLAAALAAHDDLQLLLVLTGVRPEEISEWSSGPVQPAAALSFAASADAQTQVVEPVVDQARRLAARGSHAVILIDTLDGLHPTAARKVLASARKIAGGGSLTVIATASAPLGGETTVIALDALLAGAGRFPAIDVGASWTIRPELLVGEDGAQAIARMRAQALS